MIYSRTELDASKSKQRQSRLSYPMLFTKCLVLVTVVYLCLFSTVTKKFGTSLIGGLYNTLRNTENNNESDMKFRPW